MACGAVSVAGQASPNPPTIVEIDTEAGTIVVALDEQRAPRTVSNFLRYVDARLYEDGSFYRSVRQDNQPGDQIRIEVIQGGMDPDLRERAFEPIGLEGTRSTGLRHLDGSISMARGDPDSARGEFFICIGDQPELDEGGRRNPDGRGFAAFGRVVSGMEVARRIHRGTTDGQRLDPPIAIRSIRRRSGHPPPHVPGSASAAFDAESQIARWTGLWRGYDLDLVGELFLPDARVTYFSSEREGLISGIENILEHHRDLGFVRGGVAPEGELWVGRVVGRSFGDHAVVTGVWYFGDRAQRESAQRGPVTVVYTLYGDEYRIAHMHFANYEGPPP